MAGNEPTNQQSGTKQAQKPQTAATGNGLTCGCLALLILPVAFLAALALLSGPQLTLLSARWLDQSAARPDLAQQILEVAELIWPTSARLHDALGSADLQAGRLADAIHEFDRATKLDENLATARNNLAVALLAARQPEAALQHLESAVELDPGSALIYLNLGRAYRAAGDLDRAQKATQHAADLDPQSASAWVELGNLALARGDLPQALAAFEKALSLSSDPAENLEIRFTLDQLNGQTPADPGP